MSLQTRTYAVESLPCSLESLEDFLGVSAQGSFVVGLVHDSPVVRGKWEQNNSRVDWSVFSLYLGVHLQIGFWRAQLCGDRKSRPNGHLLHQRDHRLPQDGSALTEQPWHWVYPLWKVGRKKKTMVLFLFCLQLGLTLWLALDCKSLYSLHWPQICSNPRLPTPKFGVAGVHHHTRFFVLYAVSQAVSVGVQLSMGHLSLNGYSGISNRTQCPCPP